VSGVGRPLPTGRDPLLSLCRPAGLPTAGPGPAPRPVRPGPRALYPARGADRGRGRQASGPYPRAPRRGHRPPPGRQLGDGVVISTRPALERLTTGSAALDRI